MISRCAEISEQIFVETQKEVSASIFQKTHYISGYYGAEGRVEKIPRLFFPVLEKIDAERHDGKKPDKK